MAQDFDKVVTEDLKGIKGDVVRIMETLKTMQNMMQRLNRQEIVNGLPASEVPASDKENEHLAEVFESRMKVPIQKWSDDCDKMDGELGNSKRLIVDMFDLMGSFLSSTKTTSEPDAEALKRMLGPMAAKLSEIQSLKTGIKNPNLKNHILSITEAANVVGWVSVKDPVNYIQEIIDCTKFYTVRVLMANKQQSDQTHVHWVNSLINILESLKVYVEENHKKGVTWNGGRGAKKIGAVGKDVKPMAASLPPPPPPLPTKMFETMKLENIDVQNENRPAKSASTKELFTQINRGEHVTAGLRKVVPEMQTHKNPALRNVSNAPQTQSQNHNIGDVIKQAVTKMETRIYLQDGKQWNIDYLVGENKELKVEDRKMTVYLYKCENAVITVRGKGNAITLDGCKKVSLLLHDGLVAQCELINCKSVQIQTFEVLPTVSIQKTDGCQLYLSRQAHGTEIVTSKSSEVNVYVQRSADNDDYTETPIPEQFKTVLVDGIMKTMVADVV